MTDKNDDGILIGENIWIKPRPIRGPQGFNGDQFIEPLKSFFSSFETQCAAGCCGIDAFELTPETIRLAATTDPKGPRAILTVLSEMKTAITVSGCDSVDSDLLNAIIDQETFQELLEHLISHVRTLTAAPGQTS